MPPSQLPRNDSRNFCGSLRSARCNAGPNQVIYKPNTKPKIPLPTSSAVEAGPPTVMVFFERLNVAQFLFPLKFFGKSPVSSHKSNSYKKAKGLYRQRDIDPVKVFYQ
jgi:hypothetical protein